MAGYRTHSENKRAEGEERSKRQERAHRILDAAAELIQRWGYRKIAVDDIARLAGVAKGTIYLHWKTRDDLFIALLLRESVETLKEMTGRIASDPAGISFSIVVKHAVYVILTRPLARALFIQDTSVLGELIQQGRTDLGALSQQKMLAGQQLLDFFRSRGALRTDRSVTEQIKMYATMVMGTMVIDQYMPPEMRSSPEAATELLAAMIHETLESPEPLTPEIQRELQAVWEHFVGQFVQALDALQRTALV